MSNAGKSPGTDILSSLLASTKYPMGISLSGMLIEQHPANDRDHDTGNARAVAQQRGIDADLAGMNEWCRIISAIQSQLNVRPD